MDWIVISWFFFIFSSFMIATQWIMFLGSYGQVCNFLINCGKYFQLCAWFPFHWSDYLIWVYLVGAHGFLSSALSGGSSWNLPYLLRFEILEYNFAFAFCFFSRVKDSLVFQDWDNYLKDLRTQVCLTLWNTWDPCALNGKFVFEVFSIDAAILRCMDTCRMLPLQSSVPPMSLTSTIDVCLYD